GECAGALDDVYARGKRIANGARFEQLNCLHLLAALMRETGTHAYRLLRKASVDVARVRATVMSFATGARRLPEPADPTSNLETSSEEETDADPPSSNLGGEEAPSPISFHPSLDVDPEADAPRPAGGERDTDPGISPTGVVETVAREPETPADRGQPGGESDDLSAEPADDADEAEGSEHRDPTEEFERQAERAARDLGEQLFDDPDADEEEGSELPETAPPSADLPSPTDRSNGDDPDADDDRSDPPSPDVARSDGAPAVELGTSPDYALDEETYPNLVEFGRNLTQRAARGSLDPVIGRDREIVALVDILGKRRANNPMLVGEPGVGKTAIVEGLARELVRRADSDPGGRGRAVIELELGRVFGGTQLRGSLSERLTGIKQEVERAGREVVVFLDEIHAWLDAGGGDGNDAADELKSALARGAFPCIGATTRDEYRTFIEADPAFERRFQVVTVEEPDAETAVEIADGVREQYADHHDIGYQDEAVTAAVELSRRYVHEQRLPDKALSVMDLAGSRASRTGKSAVDRRDIAEVVADMANLPTDRLTRDRRDRFLEIEGHLGERIVGQDHVLEAVSDVLRRNYAGFRGERPIGSFLFLGPTGVGKTETVKALAEFLFHDRDAVVQIDMSEYMEAHAVSRFVGAPPGYVGHDEGGQLTESVRRRPYQIVLLDEVEKAHEDIRDILLQLFEEGQLTDGKGRQVDFSNTLVVMTSNLGSEVFEDAGGSNEPIGFGQRRDDEQRRTDLAQRALSRAREAFSPELWNRLDEQLVFRPLERPEIAKIAELQLAESADRIRRESKIELTFDDDVVDHLIDNGGYDPDLGARPMRQAVRDHVEGAVAELILEQTARPGDTVAVGVAEGDIRCRVV
ncbi:MAG: AAA family ATPase, partial [Bradymonadaceae bacterium]